MTNEAKAKRLEEIAADMETCGICGPDVPLVLESAQLWRDMGWGWLHTDSHLHLKMATTVYKNVLINIREVGPPLGFWLEMYKESTFQAYQHRPTLDAAKAAAIAWVDAQEGE